MMNVAISLDAVYIDYALVTLYSIDRYYKDMRLFVIYDSDMSRSDLKRFVEKVPRSFNLSMYSDELLPLNNLIVNGHISKATYYRLYLTTLLPSNVDRILYLDTDLLVVSNDLEVLYGMEIDGYPIAAVSHSLPSEAVRLSLKGDYFQAGVLLINLSYWRKNNVVSLFTSVLNERSKELVYWDQDVLNLVFDGAYLSLPSKYNVHRSIENSADVVIFHFDGTRKPWRLRNIRPGKREWLEIAARVRMKYFFHIIFFYLYKNCRE